jgi:thiol-disulfide isomerase/thioredoxin
MAEIICFSCGAFGSALYSSWRLFVTAFLAVIYSGCASVSPAAQGLVGRTVPDGRLMLLSGEDLSLRHGVERGRALLFWATWCRYSRSAIADFEDLARSYANSGRVDFIAVSLDNNQDLATVKTRISQQELSTITHVFSGNDVQDEAFLALKGDQVPYSVFIDDSLVVRHVGVGVAGLEDVVREFAE